MPASRVRTPVLVLLVLSLTAGTIAATPVLATADGPQRDLQTVTDPSQWSETAPESYRVRFECSNGSFTVEVTRELAPLGADRFFNLVRSGFFEGGRFFRVMPGFLVQFGLSGTPEVDQAWFRARIRDDVVRGSNSAGTISFATSGPNSRTTQVFVNLADNARLDAMGFAPFGRVVDGMDVVTAIDARHREQPNQSLIRSQGNTYLEERFPELDFIRKATIVDSPSP